MQTIALDYKQVYYDTPGITQPAADRIGYNDSSLHGGGKFDLGNNWCTSCSHNEHREGLNNDTWAGNIPTGRRSTLVQIFINNGSPNYVDEVASKNHWHLRF